MKVGDKVRSVPGYEDTILPGYEGTVMEKDGSSVEIRVSRIPGVPPFLAYDVPEHQNIRLITLDHKLEVI